MSTTAPSPPATSPGWTPAAGPPPEACPLCGAPLAAEQEWCLSCGAAARTRLAAAPDWKAPVIVVAVVAALALGVLAAALVKLAGDSGPAPAPVTRTLTTAPAAALPATPGAASTAATPGATAPAVTAPTTPSAPAGSGAPTGGVTARTTVTPGAGSTGTTGNPATTPPSGTLGSPGTK